MALIIITVNDSPNGPVVGMLGEPPLEQDIKAAMTPAQVVALNMLAALGKESVITETGDIVVESQEAMLRAVQ